MHFILSEQDSPNRIELDSSIFTLSNPAVGETVLTPVKWCCNTGEVPIRIQKPMDEQTSGKKLLFSLILYKRLQ